MIFQNTFVINVIASGNVDVVASKSKRHIQMKMSQKPLNSTEKRMAFYADLLDHGKLKLTDEEAEEWRSLLPLAIEAQYFILDKGGLPQKMTLQNVRRLAEAEKRRDKTLDTERYEVP